MNSHRLFLAGKTLRTEPKHVVFLSQLMHLFKFCHACKADNPEVQKYEIGSMVAIKTICHACKQEMKWQSQPFLPGGSTPAGNLLIGFSILMTGGSPSRVIRMFEHIGIGCISLRTYFEYQRVSKFNGIYFFHEANILT